MMNVIVIVMVVIVVVIVKSVVKSVVKKVYVDVDGTVLSGVLDGMFKEMVGEVGIEVALEWYEGQVVDDLKRRVWLLCVLGMLRVCGVEMVLWTNRGWMNKEATRRNLGVWWYMFDSCEWCEGRKGRDIPVDGWVLDNESEYVEEWRGVYVRTYR